MLEQIIKKMHKKVAFSFYGILQIIVLLLPLIVIGFGIYFLASNGDNKSNGVLWIVVGVGCLLFSFRKFKDLIDTLKYVFNPKKYPLYKNLTNEGVDISKYDDELRKADVVNKLSKKNPILITENFIFGYSQVSFFVVLKDKVVWAYEYNGNGIVFYDAYKFYGFTYFPTVDGNDQLMEELKNSMPYIYFGIDFDYKEIMHDKFDETVQKVNEERLLFLQDEEGYRIKKAEEERIKSEEEAKKLEEEKNKELSEIEENSMKFANKDQEENNEEVVKNEEDN